MQKAKLKVKYNINQAISYLIVDDEAPTKVTPIGIGATCPFCNENTANHEYKQDNDGKPEWKPIEGDCCHFCGFFYDKERRVICGLFVQDTEEIETVSPLKDLAFKSDVTQVLKQTGYKKKEINQLMKKAMDINPKITTSEEMIKIIFSINKPKEDNKNAK